ncbi:MAG: HEAT repeat domain-containing protein [bacterium]
MQAAESSRNRKRFFFILAAIVALSALIAHYRPYRPAADFQLEKELNRTPPPIYAVNEKNSILHLPRRPYMDHRSYLDFVFQNCSIDIMALIPVEDRNKRLKSLDLRQARTIKEALGMLSRTCGKMRIMPLDKGMVILFGNTVEYEKKGDYARLPAVYVRVHSGEGMFRLIAEEFSVKIQVDETIFIRRERLRKAGQPLTILMEDGGDLGDLLERAAVYFGGEVRRTGEGWQIKEYLDGSQLKKETRRLLKELNHPAIGVVFPAAAESLAVIGEPALADILSGFTSRSPFKAVFLAEILGEIGGSKAVSALLEALTWPTAGEKKSDCVRCQPLHSIIKSLVKLKATPALPYLRQLKNRPGLSPEMLINVTSAVKELQSYSWF